MPRAVYIAGMKEKTKTWLELAQGDLEFAGNILKSGNRPHYSVHYCHQAIEKMLKAVVQEFCNEDPKRTHNLKMLCEQAGLKLPLEVENFLQKLSPHYLASKYPEDMKKFYKLYTLKYSQGLLSETEESFKWFAKLITSKK